MQSNQTLKTRDYIISEIIISKIKKSEVGRPIAEIWGPEAGRRRKTVRDIFFIINGFQLYYQLTPMLDSQRSPCIKLITFSISPHCSLLLSELWLPQVIHVSPARDITQFNLSHGVEVIKYIFKISMKTQFFGAPRNQGVITWCIT